MDQFHAHYRLVINVTRSIELGQSKYDHHQDIADESTAAGKKEADIACPHNSTFDHCPLIVRSTIFQQLIAGEVGQLLFIGWLKPTTNGARHDVSARAGARF